MNEKQTLWSNAQRSRHYLINDSVSLKSGNFELRSLTGKQKFVAPDILPEYEVTHEQATEWVKGQFGQIMDSAKSSIMETLRKKMDQKPDLDAWFNRREAKPLYPESDTASDNQQKAESPAMDLFSKLAGESKDKLHSDPDAMRRAVQTILGQIGEFVKDATANDSERVQSAKAQMSGLRSLLQQYGLNAGPTLDKVPDNIQKAFRSAEHELGAEELARRLESLADEIELAASGAVTWLRNQADELRQNKSDKEQETETDSGSA